VQAHYSFMDREQGYLLLRGAGDEMVQAPLMTMAVVILPITTYQLPFTFGRGRRG